MQLVTVGLQGMASLSTCLVEERANEVDIELHVYPNSSPLPVCAVYSMSTQCGQFCYPGIPALHPHVLSLSRLMCLTSLLCPVSRVSCV